MSIALCILWLALAGSPQSPLQELKADSDPSRRAERALNLAETEFDAAREAYTKGQIHSGDDHLDIMAKALDESASSLEQSHKSKLYKRAEMRVAHLQRRLSGLLDDISIEDRAWASQTERHVSEIREKLLTGAMRK